MLNLFCLAMVPTSSGSRFQSADPATYGRETLEQVEDGPAECFRFHTWIVS